MGDSCGNGSATGVGQSVFGNKAAKNRQKDALEAQREAQRAASMTLRLHGGARSGIRLALMTSGQRSRRCKRTTKGG